VVCSQSGNPMVRQSSTTPPDSGPAPDSPPRRMTVSAVSGTVSFVWALGVISTVMVLSFFPFGWLYGSGLYGPLAMVAGAGVAAATTAWVLEVMASDGWRVDRRRLLIQLVAVTSLLGVLIEADYYHQPLRS
jgi:hypothetical protein